ncbi:MAG: sigma-70 family RNA polymerase sigma factor [Alcanivorax sp.]|nr:sigma-70 family RNA polymerase sigma factor [Alcanivorax sp.]
MSFEQQICDQIPHLIRYATALCGDPGAADDLVQDCLERALRKRHLWRPSGRLRSWLFRMLYRLYINQRTSAPVRKEQPRADAGLDQTVAADQEDHVECQQALEALDQLPTEQRAALLLVALENPGYREAARILGVRVGTLRSRLSRARETLRQERDRPAVRRRTTALKRVK